MQERELRVRHLSVYAQPCPECVSLPVMFMSIRNRVRLLKLACPSPFLQLCEEEWQYQKRSRKRDHRRSWRCQETGVSHLPIYHWDPASFGRLWEWRIKRIRFVFLDPSLRYQNDGCHKRHTRFTVVFRRKYLGKVSNNNYYLITQRMDQKQIK